MRLYSSKIFLPVLLTAVATKRSSAFVTRTPLTKKSARLSLQKTGLSLGSEASSTLVPAHAATVGEEVAKSKSLLPKIIQGGMGVRISSWQLAREVSKKGGLGVISGTAMDVIFVRTLQDGEFGLLC
jgi:hypothetical protein